MNLGTEAKIVSGVGGAVWAEYAEHLACYLSNHPESLRRGQFSFHRKQKGLETCLGDGNCASERLHLKYCVTGSLVCVVHCLAGADLYLPSVWDVVQRQEIFVLLTFVPKCLGQRGPLTTFGGLAGKRGP